MRFSSAEFPPANSRKSAPPFSSLQVRPCKSVLSGGTALRTGYSMRFLARATLFGFRLAPVVLLVYWILIFTGTHLPGSELKSIQVQDKVLHFGAFAGLAFLLAWSLPRWIADSIPGVAVAAAVALVYALLDEWTQGFVAHRTPSVGDLIADSLGTMCGLITYLALRAILYGILARSRDSASRLTQMPNT